MDSNFVDLDILLTRIREPRSKSYFLDAVRAYKANALRAALSSAWVAVVYDLISKYRELSTMGNAQATAYLKDWDAATNITNKQNTAKLLRMESKILCHAAREIQFLNPHALIQLKRFSPRSTSLRAPRIFHSSGTLRTVPRNGPVASRQCH